MGRAGLKWERGEVGGKSGEGRRKGGKWECMKTSPQNATDLAFGDAPWGYSPV